MSEIVHRLARGIGCALLAGALVARGVAGAATTDATAPTVRSGRVEYVGAYSPAAAGVARFAGIPYAAPPVGRLRWRAPQPYAPRPGVFRATHFAPACYQNDYNIDWYRRIWRAFGVSPEPFHNPTFSEDCLYLNVWTAQRSAGPLAPVMVWIHGGNDVAGWSYEPNYHGAQLAARGHVIVVSIGYRLGIFGFFSHPQLAGHSAPANFGLLDQIAALRWVRAHIRAFGGDPTNVTIFGESAGGADVAYLMASPLARGLFRRAIIESGGYLLSYGYGSAQARATGAALARALPGNPSLSQMRRMPAAQIFAAALRVKPDDTYLPVVDGRSLTMSPAHYFSEYGVPVRLLMGSNANEGYMYDDGKPASLERELRAFPRPARALLARWATTTPGVRLRQDRLESFVEMACPSYLLASAATRVGHRAWVYRFTREREGSGGRRLRVYHGSEIPYVFGTQDAWLPMTAVDRALTLHMESYWTNFARSGDPNGAGVPNWPAFRAPRPRIQELGSVVRSIPAPDEALCRRVAPMIYPGWGSSSADR